jgi:hypothetical protein
MREMGVSAAKELNFDGPKATDFCGRYFTSLIVPRASGIQVSSKRSRSDEG